MSHFTCLICGPNLNDTDRLAAALQPWHEFECTGTSDEYVVDLDKLSEARDEYESGTTTQLRSSDGRLHDPYDDRFYRELTSAELEKIGGGGAIGTGAAGGIAFHSKDWGDGRGHRAKTRFVPDGYEEVNVPEPEVRSFTEYLADWHGVTIVYGDEPVDREGGHKRGWARERGGEVVEFVHRTNPNARWDWWVVGGRWSGHLISKNPAEAIIGRPGLMGARYSDKGVDGVLKRDLDLVAMKAQAEADRASEWATVKAKLRDAGVDGSGAELDRLRYRALRERASAVEAWQDAGSAPWFGEWVKGRREFPLSPYYAVLSDYGGNMRETDRFESITDWIAAAPALAPFAMVKDGRWLERGKMGWWAAVHDEKERETWEEQAAREIADVPDDHWLILVDCHI